MVSTQEEIQKSPQQVFPRMATFTPSVFSHGFIMPYAGPDERCPNGWLPTDGREISRIQYRDCFNVLGTAYGQGDGQTTFNLPNLKGKIAVFGDANLQRGQIVKISSNSQNEKTTDALVINSIIFVGFPEKYI